MDEMSFRSAAQARRFLDDVDEELGYPKRLTNFGRGPHAPGAESRSIETVAEILERSDGDVVVVIDDLVTEAARRNPAKVGLTAKRPHRADDLATETIGGRVVRKRPLPRKAG